MDKLEILIQNGETIYEVSAQGCLKWATEIRGVPGKLNFKTLDLEGLKIECGNAVRVRLGEQNVFYGFVFKVKPSGDGFITITAYDQLRYLKNKDTIVFKNMRSDEYVKRIATEFGLKTGELENTQYVIKKRIEEDASLFDMINTSLDTTLRNVKKLYVLYDEFGKLTLKNIESLLLDIVIDSETCKDITKEYSIESSFNVIKLTRENEETGKLDVYMTKDTDHINAWGKLQYYGTLKEGENGQSKADALLKLYNSKAVTHRATGVFGDLRVRAGTSIIVENRESGGVKYRYMLVERASHNFENEKHTMDLELRGGTDV